MRLVFMVEERSMEELLKEILPKILPEDVEFLIIPHNGKSDLAASIQKKLRAWNYPGDKFVIVHDQDSNDCILLKSKLSELCGCGRNEFLIRIVCRELEAWYFGDLNALSLAYGKNLKTLSGKRKYREPDGIGNPKQEIYKLLPMYQQISGAKQIGQYMNSESNTSHSFNVFVEGVKRLCST